jgi:hypothetical protein
MLVFFLLVSKQSALSSIVRFGIGTQIARSERDGARGGHEQSQQTLTWARTEPSKQLNTALSSIG